MHGSGYGRRQREEGQRGDCTLDMQRKRKKLREGREGDRYTGFSRNEGRRESKTRMTRRKEGIKQGISIFA